MPSVTWVNRGAGDGFDTTYGAGANAVRAVVDAAIEFWDRVITSFNYASGLNDLQVTINSDAPGTGFGGSAGVTSYDADGRILTGDLLLGGGDGTTPLTQGWFIDPTPNDWSEFADPNNPATIINAFSGSAPAGSPAAGKGDFFSVAAAEVTHIMGLFLSPARLQNPITGTITNTGVTDPVGPGDLYTFISPNVSALLTSNNGGAGGADFGEPVHVAFSSASAGGLQGAVDTGNAIYSFGMRSIPSNLMALVLQDAYAYTIVQPEAFGSFYALRNETTNNVLVRGGTGISADTISISRSGNELVVSVDIGTDVAGTGPTDAFVSRFPINSVTSITINAFGGNDNISISGDLSFLTGAISVDGGDGADTFTVNPSLGNPIAAGGVSFNGGTGTDTIRSSGDGDYVLTDTTLTVVGKGIVTLAGIEAADLNGGAASNTFTVSNWTLAATIDGKGGGDVIVYNPKGSGSGSVDINDTGTSGTDKATVNGTSGTDNFVITKSTAKLGNETLTFDANLEEVTLDGKNGNDTFTFDNSSGLTPVTKVIAKGGAGTNTVTIKGDGGPISRETHTVTGSGSGTIVFDPDDSGGAGAAGAIGSDAEVIAYTEISQIDDLKPVDRLDFLYNFGPSTADDLTIGDGSVVSTLDTTRLTRAGVGQVQQQFSNKGVLSVGGVGGADTITVNLTDPGDGLTSIELYGQDVSGGAVLADDNVGDTFNIKFNTIPVLAFGQGGNDVFNISSNAGTNTTGNLAGIQEDVAVNSGAGSANRLVVSDFSGAAHADVRISSSQISGLAPTAGVTIDYSVSAGGNFTNGASNDGIRVIGSNTGSDTFTVESTINGSSLNIEALGGTGTFTIQTTGIGSTADIEGPVAAAGFFTVQTTGSGSTVLYQGMSSGGTNADIQTTGANSTLTATDGTGIATFDVFSTGMGSKTTLDGMDGQGVFRIQATGKNSTLTARGGADVDTFEVRATGTGSKTTLDGKGSDDEFNIGATLAELAAMTDQGKLNRIAGKVTVLAGDGDADSLYINDRGTPLPGKFNYIVTNKAVTNDDTIARPFAGVFYDASLEDVRLDGTDGINTFSVAPSFTATITIDGNLPPFGSNPGDVLRIFANPETSGATKTEAGGDGTWTFTNGLQTVTFFSIEDSGDGGGGIINPFSIIALGTEANTASRPLVEVYDTQTNKRRFSFQPYETIFKGGVRVATGDVDGDGVLDIITAPGKGRAPLIKVYSGINGMLSGSFLAYGSSFVGGVYIAAADVNGDKVAEIITGAGPGWLPMVKVFNGNNVFTNQALVGSAFLAFSGVFKGGVRVAAGDLTGDRQAEVIIGSGGGMAATVGVFQFQGSAFRALETFRPFGAAFTGGIYLAAGDYDGDGIRDIIVSAGNGWMPQVRVFSGANITNSSPLAVLDTFFAFETGYKGGVRVAARTINGDDPEEVSQVKLYIGRGTGNNGRRIRVKTALSTTLVDAVFAGGNFAYGVYLG